MTNDFSKIPKFLRRLYRETDDPNNRYIAWSEDGEKLRIIDKEGFVKNILQTLSKTREYSGFVRQLNIYGFVKTKSEKNEEVEEYFNCFFKQNQPSLMEFIKRERKNKKEENSLNLPSLENSIAYLTNANFRLSNEVAQLKDRVEKQDRTINRLLDILGRVFRSGAQNMGFEIPNTMTRPDFFSKYSLSSDKKDTKQSEKVLSLLLEHEEKSSKKNKSPSNPPTDMSGIFF